MDNLEGREKVSGTSGRKVRSVRVVQISQGNEP